MSCTCPTCRLARKEITVNEYAWYLKGCIEIYESVLSELKCDGIHKNYYDAALYNRDVAKTYIEELRNHKDMKWDLAFEVPEKMVVSFEDLDKKEKEKNNEHV